MIDIKKVTFRNFMSYGPYDTTIPLSTLGTCFITGNVLDNELKPGQSNGAGKSSMAQAILWCLSGQTMHSKKPGNNIMNKFNDEPLVVNIELKDGTIIQRKRERDGQTELTITSDNDLIADDVISTIDNQQKRLNQRYEFDPDIFCDSVFISQFRQGWLGMSDQARRSLFERIMGIDRINHYAEAAKFRREDLSKKHEIASATYKEKLNKITDAEHRVRMLTESHMKFEHDEEEHKVQVTNKIEVLNEELHRLQSIDISALTSDVAEYERLQNEYMLLNRELQGTIEEVNKHSFMHTKAEGDLRDKKNELESKIVRLQHESQQHIYEIKSQKDEAVNNVIAQSDDSIRTLKSKITTINAEIDRRNVTTKVLMEEISKWAAKKNTTCPACLQQIEENHIDGMNGDKQNEINNLKDDLNRLISARDLVDQKIAGLEAQRSSQVTDIEVKCRMLLASANTKLSEDVAVIHEELQGLPSNIKQSEILISSIKHKSALSYKINELEDRIKRLDPKNAQMEADRITNRIKEINMEIDYNKKNLEDRQGNPHTRHLEISKIELEEARKSAKTRNDVLETMEMSVNHVQYIYKAYSDRRKIKAMIVSRYQPYFNQRLEHYMAILGMDLKVHMTEQLGLSSDQWDPKYQSGGERARTELALTFASHDMHEAINGKQSNILVLDEPDDGLDEVGINGIISIINDDLAPKYDSILVISHKDSFRDAFSSSIVVERENRLSRIARIE